MIVSDILYGSFEVESVIEELISTKAVQRLKNIHMAGPAYLANPLWNETRYEHSIGVMLLIRKLGGSIEEQIAGLLHDISHTAFSHTVDIAMRIKEENYHELIKEKVIEQSDIVMILEKYGFISDTILFDDSKFFLLEKELPSLCADRLDYTLREVHRYFDVDLEEIHNFINSLVIKENEICVDTIMQAEWFVEMYNKIVLDFFYDPLNVISNTIMSDVISYAIKHDIFGEDELLLDDYQLYDVLSQTKDEFIDAQLNRFNHPFKFKIVTKNDKYTMHLKTKPRIIDPMVYQGGLKVHSSHLSKKIFDIKSQAILKSGYGIYLMVS